MKQDAIICDIDGVLVDTSWIFQSEIFSDETKTAAEKWDFFNKNANNYDNKLNYDIIEIINKLKFFGGYTVIFVSSRSDIIYGQTKSMLKRIFPDFDNFYLYMRPEGNRDASEIIKDKILNHLQKRYKIVCAFDDDTANCAMFRGNGITTMQVVV